ncbi:hypothetical protein NBRC116593_28910 [Sulfitobacter pacificus]
MPRLPHPIDVSDDRPTLTIDWELYAAMLEDTDLPIEQQKELIETLWSIAVTFVDLGFNLNPVQQICGEADDPLSDTPPDIVSLIEEQLAQQNEEDTWQS